MPYHSETVKVCPDSLTEFVNVFIEFEVGIQNITYKYKFLNFLYGPLVIPNDNMM